MPMPQAARADGDYALWLFPELLPNFTKSAGTKLGSWIQALCKDGQAKYKQWWIEALPQGVSGMLVLRCVSSIWHSRYVLM